MIESIFLGIIQGITEFFPISSSAHLNLIKTLFSFSDAGPLFNLFTHLGSIFCLLFLLRKQLAEFLRPKKFLLIFTALLPLCFVYFFLKPVIAFFSQEIYLGYFLLGGSLLLFLSSFFSYKRSQKKFRDMLCIGFMQAFAIIPGLSRSGSTITMAIFRGWKVEEAVTFSYILAVPTVLGGCFLEVINHSEKITVSQLPHYFAGFITSFCTSFFSAKIIFSLKNRKKLSYFALYCLLLGTAAIIYFR